MWIRAFWGYLRCFGLNSFLVAGCVLLLLSFLFFGIWLFEEDKKFNSSASFQKKVGRLIYVEPGRGSLDKLLILEDGDGGYKKLYAYSVYVDALSLRSGPYRGEEFDFVLDEDRIVSCSRNGEFLCKPKCLYVNECRERLLKLYGDGWVPSAFAFLFSMMLFVVHVLHERRK